MVVQTTRQILYTAYYVHTLEGCGLMHIPPELLNVRLFASLDLLHGSKYLCWKVGHVNLDSRCLRGAIDDKHTYDIASMYIIVVLCQSFQSQFGGGVVFDVAKWLYNTVVA